MAVTPHGVLPRDSHEIPPTIGGGTQVADFTRGFTKGKFTKNIRRRNRGEQGDPDPLMRFASFAGFDMLCGRSWWPLGAFLMALNLLTD